MDVDQGDLLSLFDLSPERFAWRVPIPRQIEDRRAHMSDVLIFDILLSAGGVKHPDALYPPRDAETLARLLDAIEEATYDDLKKDALVYFLLKWQQDGREDRFQDERCIPPQFVALADAYWHLDSGINVARGVALLSDARLNRDYPSKILQAISLEENSGELALRYIRTAKPLLLEPDDIDAYSIALAECSLMEAWRYQRSFPEGSPIRSKIIRNTFRWCLTPKPRAKPLAQLLSFPFSAYEQDLLHDYALHPPAEIPVHSIPVIQDLACVRLIQSGRLSEAVRLDRQISITPIRGTYSNKLNDQARKVAADRKQIIEEIMAVMPPVERQLLEAELDQMPQSSESVSAASKATDVRSPKANGKETSTAKRGSPRKSVLNDAPLLPIPQRSGAPRFGGPIATNAPTSFAAVRSMFDSISAGRPAPEQQQPKPLTSEDTDPIIDSRDAPSVGIVPGNSDETVESISAKGTKSKTAAPRKGPVSLFDTRGSANRAPNAFFKPPSSQGPSTGSKRPRPEEVSPRRPPANTGDVSNGSALDVSEMLHEPADDDIGMQSSEANVSPLITQPLSSKSRKSDGGYSASVFSHTGAPRATSSAIRKAPSATPAPPGAFGSDNDEPVEREERTSARTQPEESIPPSVSRASPRKQPSRLTRTLSSKDDLSRSVPGAFVDEEEDQVPPLPQASTSTIRQSRRSSRASKIVDDTKPKSRATRRSSRLMVSGSERGSSPEPPSPEPPKARRTTTTRTPAKGRTRRQR